MIKLLTLPPRPCGRARHLVLSVDNRGMVELVFWPLPFTYQLPLYAVFLIGLFVGAILGGAPPGCRPTRAGASALRRKVRAIEYQERVEAGARGAGRCSSRRRRKTRNWR